MEEKLIKKTLEFAKEAIKIGETPIACLITDSDYNTISINHNLTNKNKDPLSHAEILCLQSIDNKLLRNKKFTKKLKVFITCEPCLMCLDILMKLECEIFYGEDNYRFGGLTVFNVKYEKIKKIKCGQISLLKEFYKMENLNAPICKRKIKK